MSKTMKLAAISTMAALIAGFVGCLVLNVKSGCIGCTFVMMGITMVYAIFREYDASRLTGVLGITALLFSLAI